MEGIDTSSVSPAITHSSCSAVYNHPRSKQDDVLRALADRDGYLGIYTLPFFLTDRENPDFSIFIDHLEHAMKFLGPDRVGIATDWGLWSPDVPAELQAAMIEAARKMGFGEKMVNSLGVTLKGLNDYTDWIVVTQALVRAGYDDALVRKILGSNFKSYLTRTGPV